MTSRSKVRYVVRSCEVCTVRFSRPRSAVTKGRGRFCSVECSHKVKGKVQRVCEICQAPFEKYAYFIKMGKGRFCSVACRSKWLSAEHHGMWNGGRSNSHGYARISVGAAKYRGEHILVAERALGHPLPRGAVVHHVNENKQDNRPANLVICQDVSYHQLLHARLRVLQAGGSPNLHRRCHRCKQLRDRVDFHECADCGISEDCFRCSSLPWALKRKAA